MQTLTIVLALFVVSLAGFALMRMKLRKPRRARIPSLGAAGGNPASADASGAAARKNIDPNATRIFVHTAARTPDKPPAGAEGGPIAASSLRLTCLSGPQKGSNVRIAGAGLIVGRSPSSDLVVRDACVSARHAWIGVVNDRAVLRDLNSTNGTFLNARMSSPIREANLKSGDTIFFGGHQANQWRFLAE